MMRISTGLAATILTLIATSAAFCQLAAAPDAEEGARARTQTTQANGARVVQAIDQDRMIRISERESGITLIIVETVNDADKTQRYFARSAEQLKKKHPEAFALYEKYQGQDTWRDEPTAEDSAAMQELQVLRAQISALRQQFAQNQQMTRILQELGQARSSSVSASGGGFIPGFGPSSAFGFGQARSSAFGRASADGQSSGSASGSGSSSSGGSSSGGSRGGGSGSGSGNSTGGSR